MAERSLAVLVATFRRPATLTTLLDALDAAPDPDGWQVRVVVCDNDPEASARALCADRAVTYVHEPRPGIAAARNALLDAAPDDDVVVFVDDDEWPEPGWLDALVGVHDHFGADVVTGPVISEFEDTPPPELRLSFERARRETGAVVEWPATNNALVRRAALEGPPLRFRDSYGLSGGSDSMLFLELARRGSRAVWADDAVVHELVPSSRVQLRWLLRRAYRLGNTHTRFDRDLDGRTRTMIVRGVKALGWMATGAARVGVALVTRDRRARVVGLERTWRGAGMLAALGGRRFDEYGR
jgi:glycosyltransferase involved in cell wall biosynthesis